MLLNIPARDIVVRLSGITQKPVAVLDEVGNILALSENFTYKINPTEIRKSKKAIPVTAEGEKVGYVFLDADEKEIAKEGSILKALVELMLHQRLIFENVTAEDRKANKFIYDILHQADFDEKEILDMAKLYGMDIKKPKVALIVELGGSIRETLFSKDIRSDDKDAFWGRAKRTLAFSTESFYTRSKENIVAYIGSNRFVVLKDLGDKESLKENFSHMLKTLNSFQYVLKNEFRSEVTIGVGKYYPGVKGLRESFEEAYLSMSFGSQVWGKDKIYNFDRFGVVAPLINSHSSINFSKGMFESFSNEELKKTLDTFFDNNMSLTQTAKKLKIHRNTLIYRLDKINEILNLDPRSFDDAIQIRISMLFGDILNRKKKALLESIGKKVLEKAGKVFKRPIYLFDTSGKLINEAAERIVVKDFEQVRKGKEVTEERSGKYITFLPVSYDEEVVGMVAVIDKSEKDSKDFTHLAQGFVEVLIHEEFLVKNVYTANDLRSEFIKEILTGSSTKTTEEAIDQGDIVGVNLRPEYAVFILKIDKLFRDFVENKRLFDSEEIIDKFQKHLSSIEKEIAASFDEFAQDCIVYVGENKFIILKEIRKEGVNTVNSLGLIKEEGQKVFKALDREFPGKVSIGVGQFYPGVSGLRKSFEDANIALVLGERIVGANKVYHILDVAMFVGLLNNVDGARKNELAYQVLKDLFNDKDLLKTARAFLDCGMNLTDAAKTLHLHRNTLIYRLKKVKSLIGLDPIKFHDAIQIKLGLMMYATREPLLKV